MLPFHDNDTFQNVVAVLQLSDHRERLQRRSHIDYTEIIGFQLQLRCRSSWCLYCPEIHGTSPSSGAWQGAISRRLSISSLQICDENPLHANNEDEIRIKSDHVYYIAKTVRRTELHSRKQYDSVSSCRPYHSRLNRGREVATVHMFSKLRLGRALVCDDLTVRVPNGKRYAHEVLQDARLSLRKYQYGMRKNTCRQSVCVTGFRDPVAHPRVRLLYCTCKPGDWFDGVACAA